MGMPPERQERIRPDQDDTPPVRGSDTAPFLYVEDFLDASWGGGVAKFRLVRLRPAGELEGHAAYVEVVAILAMSAANLADAHRFIGQTIERMRETGEYTADSPGDA
jgi:hypothetical protein